MEMQKHGHDPVLFHDIQVCVQVCHRGREGVEIIKAHVGTNEALYIYIESHPTTPDRPTILLSPSLFKKKLKGPFLLPNLFLYSFRSKHNQKSKQNYFSKLFATKRASHNSLL